MDQIRPISQRDPVPSPLVLLPQERVLDPLDPDDPELGLGHRLVEQAVHGPVAPVLSRYRHLQEVLVHCHGQPCLWEQAGGVGGGWGEGVGRGVIQQGRGGGGGGNGRGGGAATQSPGDNRGRETPVKSNAPLYLHEKGQRSKVVGQDRGQVPGDWPDWSSENTTGALGPVPRPVLFQGTYIRAFLNG